MTMSVADLRKKRVRYLVRGVFASYVSS